MMKLRLWVAGMALSCAGWAQAATPVQLSLPGLNLPASQQVTGARLSVLYGQTGSMTGLDVPLFALSDTNNFTGVQFGLGLGAGRVRHSFKGVAITAVNWHEGQDLGVNLGLVNLTNQAQGLNAGLVNVGNSMHGLNFGAVNIAQGNALANVGFINYAERTTFQLGLFNATQHLDGVQIGLGNYAANGIFPVLPLINISKSF